MGLGSPTPFPPRLARTGGERTRLRDRRIGDSLIDWEECMCIYIILLCSLTYRVLLHYCFILCTYIVKYLTECFLVIDRWVGVMACNADFTE